MSFFDVVSEAILRCCVVVVTKLLNCRVPRALVCIRSHDVYLEHPLGEVAYLEHPLGEVHVYGGPHQEAHVEHGLTHTPATLHLPVFNTNIRFKVIAFYNFFISRLLKVKRLQKSAE